MQKLFKISFFLVSIAMIFTFIACGDDSSSSPGKSTGSDFVFSVETLDDCKI